QTENHFPIDSLSSLLAARFWRKRKMSFRLAIPRPGMEGYVEHYNNVRLHSATGYITPKDMLAGREQEIHAERDRKLEEARKQRQIRRAADGVKEGAHCRA